MPRQKSVNVFIFDTESLAVETAAFLTGWCSDVDRAVVSAKLFDGENWRVGKDVPHPNGKGTLRIFQVERPVGEGSATYAMESYKGGYCLWCLDEIRNGTVYVVDRTMEDMEDWEGRNETVHTQLNLSPEAAAQAAVLN